MSVDKNYPLTKESMDFRQIIMNENNKMSILMTAMTFVSRLRRLSYIFFVVVKEKFENY